MCAEGALDMKDIFESFQGISKSASAFPFSSIHPSGDGRGGPIATVRTSRLSHLVVYLTTIFKDLQVIFFSQSKHFTMC